MPLPFHDEALPDSMRRAYAKRDACWRHAPAPLPCHAPPALRWLFCPRYVVVRHLLLLLHYFAMTHSTDICLFHSHSDVFYHIPPPPDSDCLDFDPCLPDLMRFCLCRASVCLPLHMRGDKLPRRLKRRFYACSPLPSSRLHSPASSFPTSPLLSSLHLPTLCLHFSFFDFFTSPPDY